MNATSDNKLQGMLDSVLALDANLRTASADFLKAKEAEEQARAQYRAAVAEFFDAANGIRAGRFCFVPDLKRVFQISSLQMENYSFADHAPPGLNLRKVTPEGMVLNSFVRVKPAHTDVIMLDAIDGAGAAAEALAKGLATP